MSTTPHLPPGERLRRLGIACWSIIGVLIVAAIAAWLLYKIRVIFPPLVLALLLIYLLNPVVTKLTRRGLPRGLASVGTFLGAIALVALLGALLYPFASRQVATFADAWPGFRSQMLRTVQDTSHDLERTFGVSIDTRRVSCLLGAEEIEGADCDQVTRNLRAEIGAQVGRLTAVGRSLIEVLLIFVLAPLLALYLLIDLPQLQRDLLNLFPENHREEAADLGSKVGRAVGGFFRGQLLVALSVGVLSAIGFKIIGLPFWLIIGAVAGFFNLIPLVGPFIGGAIGFLVGSVSGGITLGLKAAAVELIVQQVDNHFISPQVMRRTVRIHPATVMLSLLAGGALAGFWGVLLGVPAVAVAKLLLGHLWATRVLGKQAAPHGGPPGGGPPPVVSEPEPDQHTGEPPPATEVGRPAP
jgi:predicted PurR-regulated permease PerM